MSDCIEWGMARSNGYGVKKFQGKTRKAHRLAYVEHFGLTLEDIEGLVVMHTCDNPPCVNPAHLRLGTQTDNVADRDAKGRQCRAAGMENSQAKLTEYAVRWIRSLHSEGHFSQYELADLFGVVQANVSNIVNRKTWKHL